MASIHSQWKVLPCPQLGDSTEIPTLYVVIQAMLNKRQCDPVVSALIGLVICRSQVQVLL